jgi:hypothetical protein
MVSNILNKQSLRAEKGWSPSVGVTTPVRKKASLLRNVTQGLGLRLILLERREMDISEKQGGEVWPGCIWLRIASSGGLHKRRGI